MLYLMNVMCNLDWIDIEVIKFWGFFCFELQFDNIENYI